MILRGFILAASVAGALGAAQFPAFSQQYLQRLGGAVDALQQVILDFDASAASLGLSREEALAQMTGSAFVQARRADMQQAFRRYDGLRAALDTLEGQGPFMRAYHFAHLTDGEIVKGAWEAFEPALPITFASALFAGVGGVAGGISAALLAGLLRSRRRSKALSA
ncbi:DUF2937 domain-containing protein [Roseobacter denitrificans]|uniref:DUF2937 family protein n=1 Tax=Roseobacter denitrificans (strain ATCC 33942 / OCh 114) TaxID=375451 RepID=Q168E5_ROSDO|nr:DUF2937 family protein [Roseobacter denitrificans]ABG31648.1 hypothetical protein RD1_2046 [Roseobacter denitrificans OCh 114]AVL54629.1 DUF2937 domain-containing protein [Roseobacter denitrificans]SFF88843.1 Protein of unknown function [Roseobacter denitrificans OCh 114]